MAQIVRQLSIFMANKPGALASVSSLLAGEDINLLAVTVSDTIDHAVVRVVVSNPSRARDMFEEAGVLVIETDILAVNVTNKIGELARITQTLASVKVNVEYLYGSAPAGGRSALFCLRVDDVKKAQRSLAAKKAGGKKVAQKKATKKKTQAKKKAGKKSRR
jgi:hypothetical protein